MEEDKYIKAIEKMATGYEYEEIQTIVSETKDGMRKKVIRNKKYMPPNFQAAQYMINKNKRKKNFQDDFKKMDEDFKKMMEDLNYGNN